MIATECGDIPPRSKASLRDVQSSPVRQGAFKVESSFSTLGPNRYTMGLDCKGKFNAQSIVSQTQISFA